MYKIKEISGCMISISFFYQKIALHYVYNSNEKRIMLYDKKDAVLNEFALGAELFAKNFLEHNKDFLK